MNCQDQLIQKAIAKQTVADQGASKIDTKRIGLLDESGLERARHFLEEQKKTLEKCKNQFVRSYLTLRKRLRKL